MKWIKTHKLISFLLAIILISLVILLSSVAAGGKGNFVSNFFNSAYSFVEKPVSSVAGGISKNVSGIFAYKELQKENQALEKENAKLREQLTNTGLKANELKELKDLSRVLKFKGISGKGDIVSADVIAMNMNGVTWMNNFTIDAGTESGIKAGSVVVCGDGLVGRVHSAGKGWAKVISIIDESSKISFKIDGNLRMIGIVEGISNGEMSGFMLDSKAKVSEGDKIITSGMGVYPAGIEIGRITKVRYDSNAQLQRVEVKPSVEFSALQKVSVIL